MEEMSAGIINFHWFEIEEAISKILEMDDGSKSQAECWNNKLSLV